MPQEPKVAAVEEKKETRAEPVKVEVVLSLPPGVTVQPKTEDVKAVAVQPDPVLRPEPFEERLLEAVTLTSPLSELLGQETVAAIAIPVVATEADTLSEPVTEAAAEIVAPPSQN
jgi:hypothetical protein